MIELRYLVRPGWDGPEKVLQYRSKYDTTIWATRPTPEQRNTFANYQWSEWADVPTVEDK